MKRGILIGALAVLIVQPVTVLAKPAAPVQQGVAEVTASSLAKALIKIALQLPENATKDDYLEAFMAEIAGSGASADTVMAALDAAFSAPALNGKAQSAINSLRKRKHAGRDHTAGVDNDYNYEGPGVTTGGGSDYVR